MQLSGVFAVLASALVVSASPNKRLQCAEASKGGLLTTQTSPWVANQTAQITVDYTCTIQLRGVPKVSDYYIVSTLVSGDGNQLDAYLGRHIPNVTAASPVDSFTINVPGIEFLPPSTSNYTLRNQFTYSSGDYDQVLTDEIFITVQPSEGTTPPPAVGKTIRPGNNGTLCLTAAPTNSAPAVVEVCTGASDQAWAYAGVGTSGPITIYNGTYCLDVTNGNTTPGQALQVYSCSAGDANQQWYVTSDDRIAWTNEGQCVDLTNGVAQTGNIVQAWTCTDNDAYQVWNFV